jgi:hypothetical protein
MMDRRVEIRNEGMFTIQEVDDKPIVQQVARGWHVLFTDSVGNKRFGYVLKIDLEKRQFHVLDAIMYPNAPSPLGAESEIVSFEAVIIAQQGFNWLRDVDIYGAGKKIGKRQVAIIIKGYERDAEVGWFVRKAGRTYVDRQGDRWQLRSTG